MLELDKHTAWWLLGVGLMPQIYGDEWLDCVLSVRFHELRAVVY